MELKGFMEEVKELVNKELGDDYELGIKDVLKNNGKLYHGLEVKKRLSNIAPVLTPVAVCPTSGRGCSVGG